MGKINIKDVWDDVRSMDIKNLWQCHFNFFGKYGFRLVVRNLLKSFMPYDVNVHTLLPCKLLFSLISQENSLRHTNEGEN